MPDKDSITMKLNTLENRFSSICVCGTGSRADEIYGYLNSNKNISVARADAGGRHKTSGSDELILYAGGGDEGSCGEDGQGYVIDWDRLNRYNETNPYYDIYNNIYPKFRDGGVRLIVVRTPDLRLYRHRLPLFISMAYYRQVQGRSKDRDRIFLGHYGQADLYQDFIKTRADISKGYLRVYGNTDRINYDDGFRRINSEYGNEYKTGLNSVYLFGFCVAANPMLPDDQTIGFKLQERLGSSMRVLSRGNDGSAINLIMRGIKYRQGDICVLFSSHKDKRPDELGIETIDLTNCYANVPKLWRHIADGSYHCDAYIAEIIADEIHKKLCLNSSLKDGFSHNGNNEAEISFGPAQKRCPGIHMYSDDNLIRYVKNIKEQIGFEGGYYGAAVMNCNPFTYGHRYLIESCAAKVDRLIVFVVEEDKSEFSFEDRFEMVREGTRDLRNVFVTATGKYMISADTVPGYFDKKHHGNIKLSAKDDMELFASIAGELGISIRFAGTEPKDGFTRSYNEEMRKTLPQYGIRFEEVERKAVDGEAVSASKVRSLIKEGKYEELCRYIPASTYRVLEKKGYVKSYS